MAAFVDITLLASFAHNMALVVDIGLIVLPLLFVSCFVYLMFLERVFKKIAVSLIFSSQAFCFFMLLSIKLERSYYVDIGFAIAILSSALAVLFNHIKPHVRLISKLDV